MTTTEDALMPLVMDQLAAGMANCATWPQNPRGVTTLFGASRAAPNAEVVALTGLVRTTVEPNREEVITFDVAITVNIPGLDELRTWERRTVVTDAVIGVFVAVNGAPQFTDAIRALHVYHWRVSERLTSCEPANGAIPGATGWVGYSLLTIEAKARPCC